MDKYYLTINRAEFDTPENNVFLSELEGVETEQTETENIFKVNLDGFEGLKKFMLNLEKHGWFGIIDFEDNEIFVEQYSM